MQSAHVLLVGAGGLGVPCATYLAGCGVGRLTIVDPAFVDPPDLPRQFAYTQADVGRPKVDVLRDRLHLSAPATDVEAIPDAFDVDVALDLVGSANVVIDASDNPATRFLVSDACVLAERPLISGAASRLEGQVMHLCGGTLPCYRCLVPVTPALAQQPSCAEEGVLAPITGMVGAWMALEGVRRLTRGLPAATSTLWHLDASGPRWHAVRASIDPNCSFCGPDAKRRSLAVEASVCRPGDPLRRDDDLPRGLPIP